MSLISMFDIAKKDTTQTDSKAGFVVDNNDPLKLGRIKVTIPDVYVMENNDPSTLPWIWKFNNSFLGGSKNSECFSVPELNSLVWVMYPLDDLEFPFYTNYPYGQSCQTNEFTEDYPNMYGFKDSSGLLVRVNKRTKDVYVRYNDKYSLNINGETGKMDVFAAESVNLNTNSAINVTCSANMTINCSADVNLKANTVNVNASKTNLGSGGPAIARVGDAVRVGNSTGTIISGGTNTSI